MCKKVEKDIDKLMKHWYHNEIKNTASNLREKLADQKKLQKDLDHKRKLKKTGMVLGVAGVVAIASYLGYKNRSQLLSLYHTFMKPNK